jgi:hypothetical protein
MDDYSFARYDKFVRVFAFGQKNAADVAATDGPQHLAKLGTIITGLDQAKAGQGGGSATPVAVLRDALRLDVQNITRTARGLAQDDPNYNVLFRPPTALNPRALLTAADAIIGNLIVDADKDDDATKTAKAARIAKFTAKGLPADFATHLVADRQAIDDAHNTEQNADNDSVENTAAISRLVDDGMKECTNLDAIFHNVYTHNAEKLTAWLSASHLARVRKHADKPALAPAPPATGTK